jgi:hypothetical protein
MKLLLHVLFQKSKNYLTRRQCSCRNFCILSVCLDVETLPADFPAAASAESDILKQILLEVSNKKGSISPLFSLRLLDNLKKRWSTSWKQLFSQLDFGKIVYNANAKWGNNDGDIS